MTKQRAWRENANFDVLQKHTRLSLGALTLVYVHMQIASKGGSVNDIGRCGRSVVRGRRRRVDYDLVVEAEFLPPPLQTLQTLLPMPPLQQRLPQALQQRAEAPPYPHTAVRQCWDALACTFLCPCVLRVRGQFSQQ